MAAPTLDLYAVLYDAAEILRDLSKVSRAQLDEIEELGGVSWKWDHARELQERAESASAGLQVALETVALMPLPDTSESEDYAADNDGPSHKSLDEIIEQWRAKTRALQEDHEITVGMEDDIFTFTNQDMDNGSDSSTQADDEEEDGDAAGDKSFMSALSGGSNFWQPKALKWSDESDELEDSFYQQHDTSNSFLNVPELLSDNSARFDSASDSGDSFVSSDMNAHSGNLSDADDTACSENGAEELDEVADDVAAQDASEHQPRFLPRGRTVSFNVLTKYGTSTGPHSPSKGSPKKSLLHRKSASHLRSLGRMTNSPNMAILAALDE